MTSSEDESSIDSDMDSEELEAREAEMGTNYGKSNQHGFVYEADLNTYRMNK